MGNKEKLFVGIDGGGTHCRVKLESSSGELLGIGHGGSANPSHGLAVVSDSIMTAIRAAIKQADLTEDAFSNMVVGAGLAGLHLTSYRKIMTEWQHPFAELYLTDDLHVATIGAHEGSDGAVVIVGTGYSALSVVAGIKTSIGGYGFLQGDRCSGAWIGYQAVQAVLLAYDNLAEPTILSELLMTRYQAQGCELADLLVDAKASDYGTLAPVVFDAAQNGDKVAIYIIEQSAQFMRTVIQQLLKTSPPRLSLIGSVAQQLIKRLDHHIAQHVSPALAEPEVGAMYFARQQFKDSGKHR